MMAERTDCSPRSRAALITSRTSFKSDRRSRLLTGPMDAGRIDSDVIRDFAKGVDELQLSEKLWTGTLTKAQVVSQFASVVAGDVVFDFGSGQKITLDGISSTSGLESDIAFL